MRNYYTKNRGLNSHTLQRDYGIWNSQVPFSVLLCTAIASAVAMTVSQRFSSTGSCQAWGDTLPIDFCFTCHHTRTISGEN